MSVDKVILAAAMALAFSGSAAPASARISANGSALNGLEPNVEVRAGPVEVLAVELPPSRN